MANFTPHKASKTIVDFMATGEVYWNEDCGESRTYLVLEKGSNDLLGFFTLGITSLEWTSVKNSEFWQGLSGKKQKHLSRHMHNKDGFIGVYTIGELARRNDVGRERLPGETLLQEALARILEARQIAGGRFVLVDSRKKLYERLYSKAGFQKVAEKESPNGPDDGIFFISMLPIENLLKSSD
ncbi:hypothetical protein [Bombiscardovia coagulans]|nr:hypothetical protein [Bombiscardovia coagulans]